MQVSANSLNFRFCLPALHVQNLSNRCRHKYDQSISRIFESLFRRIFLQYDPTVRWPPDSIKPGKVKKYFNLIIELIMKWHDMAVTLVLNSNCLNLPKIVFQTMVNYFEPVYSCNKITTTLIQISRLFILAFPPKFPTNKVTPRAV